MSFLVNIVRCRNISVLAALIPCIRGRKISITVNPRGKFHVRLFSKTVVTHIRVTINSDDRVTMDINLGGIKLLGDTAIAEINVSSVDVVDRIAVVNPSLLTKMRTVNTRNHYTVSCPNIVQCRILINFTIFILHIHREIQLGTLTNVLCRTSVVENHNVVRNDKTRNILMDTL